MSGPVFADLSTEVDVIEVAPKALEIFMSNRISNIHLITHTHFLDEQEFTSSLAPTHLVSFV